MRQKGLDYMNQLLIKGDIDIFSNMNSNNNNNNNNNINKHNNNNSNNNSSGLVAPSIFEYDEYLDRIEDMFTKEYWVKKNIIEKVNYLDKNELEELNKIWILEPIINQNQGKEKKL